MAIFSYSGRDQQGEKISGQVDAITIDEARSLLLGRDVIPTELKEYKGRSSGSMAFSLRARVRTPELLLFTKQLRTMLNAGLTFIRILGILKAQSTNKTLILPLTRWTRTSRRAVQADRCLFKTGPYLSTALLQPDPGRRGERYASRSPRSSHLYQ